jgi:predicted nucleotidyltransferase
LPRDDFNENSDADLIMDFEEKDPFKYTDLIFRLEIEITRNTEKISRSFGRESSEEQNI